MKQDHSFIVIECKPSHLSKLIGSNHSLIRSNNKNWVIEVKEKADLRGVEYVVFCFCL